MIAFSPSSTLATGRALDAKATRFAKIAHGPVRAIGLLLGGLVLSVAAQAQAGPPDNGQPQLDLPRLDITSNMHRVDAQVAATPLQRQIGLMYRQSMPEHEGMLFVFDAPSVQCFWMKNTVLPLTAAFVADDGRIVNLVDMQPLSTDSHCSAEPVRYVLEMNQGWFAKRGIDAGAQLRSSLFQKPVVRGAQP